jgi:TPR repeat protein
MNERDSQEPNVIRYGTVVALLLVSGPWVQADFASGMQAFESGDFVAAREQWLPLAEAGMVEAQYNLGLLYYHGKGLAADLTEAHRWYLLAAEAGYARAQYRAAEMYEAGEGVRKDLIQAHFWFRMAGAQRHADAKKRKKHVAKKMTPEQIAYSDLLMRQRKRRQSAQD